MAEQPLAPIVLLHADELLVVADKPAGLASVAERDPSRDCLRARLERQLGTRLWAVHRLDKDASGAIVFARDAASHRRLSLAFERHEVSKTYLALVHGVPAEASGEIDLPLRAFGSGRTGVDRERGKPSLTRWTLVRRVPRSAPGGPVGQGAFALLEVRLVTGRRHQIRAHLNAVGHPVAGDLLYGDRRRPACVPRLLLHAARLELPRHAAHPAVPLTAPPDATPDAPPAAPPDAPPGPPLVVTAPLPRDFETALDALESGAG